MSLNSTAMFLLPNISSFEMPEPAVDAGRIDWPVGELSCSAEVGASAGVPTLLLLIALFIILKQNLDRVLAIMTRIQIFFRTITGYLRRRGGEDSPTAPTPVQQGAPRNLTDSELRERGESLV